MNDFVRLLCVVAIGWGVTFGLRALPFLLFAGKNRELPLWVERFGAIVSPVIIAGLIIYSYSGLAWKTAWPYLAGMLTVGLHLILKNGLVSIIAGTILYMVLLAFCGCTTERTIVDLDTDTPELFLSSGSVRIGERRIDPSRAAYELQSAGIRRDRTIRIHVDDTIQNPSEAKSLMTLLRRGGYTRTVLVTDNRAKSQNLEIALKADGFHIGEKVVSSPNAARNAIRSEGIDKQTAVFIIANNENTMPAYQLRMLLKGDGYRSVDVVEAAYNDQFVFYVTKQGVRYGLLTWVEPEDVLGCLKGDQASNTSLIRLCGLAADFKSKDVMKIMLYLEDILNKAGYTNVRRFWLEDAKGPRGERGGRR